MSVFPSAFPQPVTDAISARVATSKRIAVPFQIDESGHVATVEGRGNIVRQDIFAFFMTKLSERVMELDYGSRSHLHLWNSMENQAIGALMADLSEAVAEAFPFVSLPVVRVEPSSPEEGTLQVVIEYVFEELPARIDIPANELLVEG